MHIFLQGARGVGKSTVIRRTLDIVFSQRPLVLSGFFTWKGKTENKDVYIHSARQGEENDIFRIARADKEKGGLTCDIQVFEQIGVQLLNNSKDADVIIMDELGYLESNAAKFIQTVYDLVAGQIPVFGVLRLGDVPWHERIKRDPSVRIYDINEENRDNLPRELAEVLQLTINN